MFVASARLRQTVSTSMQSRASCANGKVVGVDGISSEVLKALSWRAVQKNKTAFERRYLGFDRGNLETWIWDVIVPIPKKNF